MFDLYGYIRHWRDFEMYYPAPRALTANQLRVKKIKRKVQAQKMLRTNKGLRRTK